MPFEIPADCSAFAFTVIGVPSGLNTVTILPIIQCAFGLVILYQP